ncbi:MAG: ABC transporter permease [Alphaproteobacteria bacterium]|nr:ABC transporter permease [Alphaproteobacteria bacterium]
MKARWGWLILPPLLFSTGLLVATQLLFVRISFFRDLRLGRMDDRFQLANYVAFFTDPFYLDSLRLTVEISALVAVLGLVVAYPVAYVLARMPPRWGTTLLALAVASSFITIVIKILGLVIIFGGDGPLNAALIRIGIVARPIGLYGSVGGVVVGLLLYTVSFMLLILFSVIQTIPRSLEQAAEIHGAARWRVFWRVILPLSLPGMVGGGLIVFNMAMGAFTSAALLGGGKVLTLPVVIQQTVLVETKYGMAGTLSAVVLLVVLLINLLSVLLVSRLQAARGA